MPSRRASRTQSSRAGQVRDVLGVDSAGLQAKQFVVCERQMITQYVTDTSDWKPWQREYQFGVLLVIPPEPPLNAVNALRTRYAWSQTSECDAHISLTIPLSSALTQPQWEELQTIASSFRCFSVRYGPLRH